MQFPNRFVRCDVLTAVDVNYSIWEIRSRSRVKVNTLSKEHTASILTVETWATLVGNRNDVAFCFMLVTSVAHFSILGN